MLYICGETRKIGRVDDGNAFLDNFDVERRRGITVFSKQAVLHYGDTEFVLLDTPGHIDFSSETERTFSVLDCAVMVISGIDGVQSHTETLWRLLDSYNIPVFIFVNKTDITPKSHEELMNDIHSRLGSRCTYFGKDRPHEELFEEISLCDENIMNEYLENGSVGSDSIRRAVSERKIFPVMFGSALKLDGVTEFLDILSEYIPEKTYGSTFGAKVYKITEDGGVRLTHMKLTGGSLAVRTPVGEEKITALRLYSGEKYTTVPFAEAGMAVAAEGLSKTYAGQGLG
ncbi:MAG: GTP-binding protein, partial [Oscillospiraceae bacterium]